MLLKATVKSNGYLVAIALKSEKVTIIAMTIVRRVIILDEEEEKIQ